MNDDKKEKPEEQPRAFLTLSAALLHEISGKLSEFHIHNFEEDTVLDSVMIQQVVLRSCQMRLDEILAEIPDEKIRNNMKEQIEICAAALNILGEEPENGKPDSYDRHGDSDPAS